MLQIWFQNRRQNSRRKAQPLSADEILNRLHSNSDGTSLNNDAIETHTDPLDDDKENVPAHRNRTTSTAQSSQELNVDLKQYDTTSVKTSSLEIEETRTETQITDKASRNASELPSFSTMPTELSASQPLISSQDSASGTKTGYLANRRSASFAQSSGGAEVDASQQRSLKRTGSVLRLSMGSDGKAQVISNISPSPSPPRKHPLPASAHSHCQPGGLRRSFSAAGLNDKILQAEADLTARKFQRTSSGRSRDSRAWAFWCDSEARNSLAEKAQQESSGSAADAIGLMRSNSRNAAALKADPNRRQALKVVTHARSQSSLSRSTTATGRLPTETRKNDKATQVSKGKHKDEDDEFEHPNTDSDKENWEPTNGGSQPLRRRPTISSQGSKPRRAVLGESKSIPSQSTSLGAMMARERRFKGGSEDTEKIQPHVDEEVSRFMGAGRGSSARTSIGSGEEMDCVQGLLSLSQGIWR